MMKHKASSGQGLVEYGLILILVALASIVVLSVLGPSIGVTFNNAADDASNPEIRAIQQRQTAIALGTETFEPAPTTAYTVGPPTSTFTAVPPGSTLTNTPVVPGATNTFTAVPPTATNTATATYTPTATNTPTNTPIVTSPTPDWILCATEGGTCSFSGTMEVRYGEAGSYFYLILTNGTPCTNAVFGDPVVGTLKHCHYRPTTLVPTAAATNTFTPTPIPPTATFTFTPAPPTATFTASPVPTNAIVSISATRRTSGTRTNKNRVDVLIVLAHRGSLVTITDTQAGEVITLQNCNNTGSPTCSFTISLSNRQTDAGTMTVSGPDFGGQTMSDDYDARQ
jgi:Flp pilus assembly pilin Flp